MIAVWSGRENSKEECPYARSVASNREDPYDDSDFDVDDCDVELIRRTRVVRWTAILVVASFVLAGMSSLLRWW